MNLHYLMQEILTNFLLTNLQQSFVSMFYKKHLLQTILESTVKNNSEYEHLAVLKCKTKTRFLSKTVYFIDFMSTC